MIKYVAKTEKNLILAAGENKQSIMEHCKKEGWIFKHEKINKRGQTEIIYENKK